MKKNFYEILEIDLNASPEIVEKAYKTLAKKYHPDLQKGDKKYKYEEKLKLINEAYETLSDPEKRKAYDETLPGHVSAEEYENLRRQKEYMKDRITRMEQQNNGYSGNGQQPNMNYTPQQNANRQAYVNQATRAYQQQVNDAINKAYHDAYIQDLRNRGYRIRYKKTWKDYVAILMTLLCIFIVLAILWQIPPIQNYFIDLYNNNSVIKFIVDFFIRFFDKFKKG